MVRLIFLFVEHENIITNLLIIGLFFINMVDCYFTIMVGFKIVVSFYTKYHIFSMLHQFPLHDFSKLFNFIVLHKYQSSKRFLSMDP